MENKREIYDKLKKDLDIYVKIKFEKEPWGPCPYIFLISDTHKESRANVVEKLIWDILIKSYEEYKTPWQFFNLYFDCYSPQELNTKQSKSYLYPELQKYRPELLCEDWPNINTLLEKKLYDIELGAKEVLIDITSRQQIQKINIGYIEHDVVETICKNDFKNFFQYAESLLLNSRIIQI